MTTRIGTSYFVTARSAYRYFRPYGLDAIAVKGKIVRGEIHLGRPEVKPGQRLEIIDNGTRYAIVEG